MTESSLHTTFLAIESSCDETAAAVVRGRSVISSVVASQAGLHDRFGGVVPEIASRRHLETVDAVIDEALAQAGLERPDAIAVTQGPGLVGALLVGLAAAKARAWAWGLPLVTVDHLHGHVASALLADPDLEPPFACLLVSGGHSLALMVEEGMRVKLLGSTRDDAAGEAFDKGARLLGLGMPGGPAIERAAEDGDPRAVPFTPAMVHHDTLDTSFSGLKTALAVAIRSRDAGSPLAGRERADMAASYQEAIIATIAATVRKLLRHTDARTLAVVGGVAANRRLRDRIEEECRQTDTRVVAAPLRYCGDNAAMIGVAAAWRPLPESASMQHVDAYATSPLFRSGSLLPMELP